jgi:hypothetical protein
VGCEPHVNAVTPSFRTRRGTLPCVRSRSRRGG